MGKQEGEDSSEWEMREQEEWQNEPQLSPEPPLRALGRTRRASHGAPETTPLFTDTLNQSSLLEEGNYRLEGRLTRNSAVHGPPPATDRRRTRRHANPGLSHIVQQQDEDIEEEAAPGREAEEAPLFCPEIEQILWRKDPDRLYLVKRKGRSYLSTEWLSELAVLESSRLAKCKLNRFNKQFDRRLLEAEIDREEEQYFDQSYLEPDRVLLASELFPVIHQKKSQQARTHWFDGLILVLSKLINFTKQKTHFGILLKELAHGYDPTVPDLNVLLNRLYLDYYKSPAAFWTQLAETLYKCHQLSPKPQGNLAKVAATLLQCSVHLYRQWHSLAKHRFLLFLYQNPALNKRKQEVRQESQMQMEGQQRSQPEELIPLQQLQRELKSIQIKNNILLQNKGLLKIEEINNFDPGPFNQSIFLAQGQTEVPLGVDLNQEDFTRLDLSQQTERLYLVKWKNLSYLQASWQQEKDIANTMKINQYRVFNRSLDKQSRALMLGQNKSHVTLLELQGNPKKMSRLGHAYVNDCRNRLYSYDVGGRRSPVQYSAASQPVFRDCRRLRPYQLQSLNWLIDSWYSNRNVILADQMGLGKTIQSVAFLNHLANFQSSRGPFLVIAPLSTLDHWKRTVQDWTSLNCVYYYDQQGQQGRARIRDYEWYYTDISTKGAIINSHQLHKFQVVITSYEVFLQDFSRVFQFVPLQFIVVDEAHRLKNQNAKILASLKTLCCKRVLLLTGTPIQNNTAELWSLLNFIQPTTFPTLENFQRKFGQLTTAAQLQQLNDTLKYYLLRRRKQEVQRSIPPLQETIVDIQMTNIQKTIYRALYEKNKSMLMKGMSSNSVNATLNNLEMQLRKCCNHPFLIREIEQQLMRGEGLQSRFIKLMQSSGKMVLVKKLLEKFKREGKKVLIFSQFTYMLKLLEELLLALGLRYQRIDGQIKARDRQNAIDRFNNKDIPRDVFLLSTKAGGIGINLTSANVVIIYDSDWNPQNDIQATARAHRIGQLSEVLVYRLITKKTYQAEMFERATRKLGLDQAIFLGGAYHKPNREDRPQDENKKLSKAEIEVLLKKGILGLIEDGTEGEKLYQDNIDAILESNSRIAKYSLINGSYSFSKSEFVPALTDQSINLTDPDFWSKVLKNIDTRSQSLLKEYDKGNSSATSESQTCFMHEISLCVKDLIESKLTLTGFNSEDEKCLSQLLSKVEADKNYCKPLRDLASNWLYEVMRPSRRFKHLTVDDLQAYIKKPVQTTKFTDLDNQVYLDSAKQQNYEGRENGKADQLVKKVCFKCQQPKCTIHCPKFCKRAWHRACLQGKGAPAELSLEHDRVKELLQTRICEQCSQNTVQCFVCKQGGKYFGSEYQKSRKQRPNVIKLKKREEEQSDRLEVEEHISRNEVTKCSTANCNRFYHYECIDTLENSHLFKYIDSRSFHFRCALHYCAKCSESGQTMSILQCVRCPRALHLRCLEKDKVLKINKKYFICDKHKAVIRAKPKQVNYFDGKAKASSRKLLNQDYKQLKYQKKTRQKREACEERPRVKIELSYEELEIPPPAQFNYDTFQRDWCRYCGARFHSNFTKGPWGPKTLCTVHYLEWAKKKSLALGEYPDRPTRPINPQSRQELRFISEQMAKNQNFCPKQLLDCNTEQYKRRTSRRYD